MSTAKPLVTVIIATYNWSSVLKYSIASVLWQTFRDFELLVIGDGCSDDSEAVVQTFTDARVRWINLPANTGHQSGPNNEGLRQARGELIAYLGHDDLWLPHHLEYLVAAISKGDDLAYGITELVGPEGRLEVAPFKFDYSPGMWLPPTGMLHRRAVTELVGSWKHCREISIDPETELWQRAYQAGQKFVFVPHLTAIKFPALWRSNAYKTRSCHEQSAWSARILQDANIETAELVKLLAAAKEGRMWTIKPLRYMLTEVFSESWHRIRRELASRLKGNRKKIEARRKFKGLPPA